MKMNMLSLYEKILILCGYEVDDNGQVRKKLRQSLPVSLSIDGVSRNLVLPTKTNLTTGDIASRVFFHPFQENLMRGESRVVSAIRKEFIATYGSSVASLLCDIVDISSGSVKHTDLTTYQREVIGHIGEIDARFKTDFNKVIENMFRKSSRNTPVSLSLRKGIEIGGRTHSRAAIWSSPLFDEVLEVAERMKESKDYAPRLCGVSIRKGDVKTYLKLCETFFPDITGKDNPYYGFSDATDAPYFEAFVRSMLTLPKHINQIAKGFYGKDGVYSKEINKENLESTYLNIDWLEKISPFTVMDWRKEYLLIPQQDGNEGLSPIEKAEASEIPLDKTSKEADDVPWEEPKTNRWDDVTQSHTGHTTVKETTQPIQAESTNQFLRKSQPTTYTYQDRQPVQEDNGNQFARHSHSNGRGFSSSYSRPAPSGPYSHAAAQSRDNGDYRGYSSFGRGEAHWNTHPGLVGGSTINNNDSFRNRGFGVRNSRFGNMNSAAHSELFHYNSKA